LPPTADPAVPLPPVASTESTATLALERRLKAQEKRIAELSSQLRLLKRIDLERNKP
jgi:bacterioferritin (cytochrome b1)